MGLFRKPSAKKLGLKVLVMGEKGVGKSVFTLSFPKVYAMDAETGMAFYESHPVFGKNLEAIANTQDFNELQEAIEEMMDLEEGTLVIDSETKFYQNLTDASLKVEEAKARNNGKNVDDSAVSMRGWGRIKSVAQRLQNLKIDLSAKGVNVISVSQIDDVKQKVGDNFVKIGEKPVMQKGSEYDYDIVLKLYTEMDANKNVSYKGLILKDRTGVTKVGQVVSDPSYDTWRLFLESRDGADKIQSTLSKDLNKSQKALKEEDAELEKTLTDKFRELVAKSEEHKTKLIGLVQKAGIENPLSPKANELKKLEEIIKLVSAI